mmetsp:Transcript_85197/g.275867  ORF Transcript_85197/g.275867 Transcript_85197/m.275867 type:complete len:247 (+) Transcript_85197:2014-2754(+)
MCETCWACSCASRSSWHWRSSRSPSNARSCASSCATCPWLASKSKPNWCFSCLYVDTSSSFSCRSGNARRGAAAACARRRPSCASRRKKSASVDHMVRLSSGCSTRLKGAWPSVKRRASGEALRLRASSCRMASAATSEGISTSRPTARSSWCVLVVAVPWKLPVKRMLPGSTAGAFGTVCARADHRSSSWSSYTYSTSSPSSATVNSPSTMGGLRDLSSMGSASSGWASAITASASTGKGASSAA